MRRVIFIFFLAVALVAVSNNCKAQGEDKIKKIRTVFEQTNSYKPLTTKKLENEEYLEHMTDGGGELTGYYNNDTLLKITDWVSISSGIVKDEYYFDKNKLVFVYEVQQRFGYNDSLQAKDYSKQKTVFEGRYYFYNDSLIQTKLKGTSFARSPGQAGAPLSNIFLQEADKYAEMLKKEGHH